MTLTKDMLADMIRSKVVCSSRRAKELLEVLLEEMKAPLASGKDVKISGFGKWVLKDKRPRPGRNPHTGSRIEITARRVVVFHPSDKLRNLVSSHNEPSKSLSTDIPAS